VTPRNELEAQKLLGFIRTRLKGTKIALLHDEAQYGSVGASVVESEAKAQNVQIVVDDSFAINATDLTPQLQKAKDAGADTILIWTASPAAALLVRQARQLGLKVNIVGSTGIVSDNFLKVSGRDGYGVYADQSLDLTHPTPEQAAFITAYRGTYHARANNFASFAWDAAHVAAWALDRTKGDPSGDAVANALETMKPLRGSTGLHAFSATDHNGMEARDIRIVIEHGAWETLAAQ
jgi:branched-chain amino acid transport system substrate-binding protein